MNSLGRALRDAIDEQLHQPQLTYASIYSTQLSLTQVQCHYSAGS